MQRKYTTNSWIGGILFYSTWKWISHLCRIVGATRDTSDTM